MRRMLVPLRRILQRVPPGHEILATVIVCIVTAVFVLVVVVAPGLLAAWLFNHYFRR